jgi:hypothetical protein
LIPRLFLFFRRVHFVTAANLPFSMTDTVYDVAKKRAGPDGDLSFHITLIDTVMLAEDLEFLLPLTAIYVTNAGWDGVQISIDDIAPVILESHIFQDLIWCDDFRALAGMRVESLNGETWFVTVNDEGFPCFLTEETFGGPAKRSCITECDLLARNGLVHVMDELLVYETDQQDDASQPVPQLDFGGSAPTFTRPTGGSSPASSPTGGSSFDDASAVGSAFDNFGNSGSSQNGGNGNGSNSGAASKMGVFALAGGALTTVFLMLL